MEGQRDKGRVGCGLGVPLLPALTSSSSSAFTPSNHESKNTSHSHVQEHSRIRHARVAGVRQGGQEGVFDVVAVKHGGKAPSRTPRDDHLDGERRERGGGREERGGMRGQSSSGHHCTVVWNSKDVLFDVTARVEQPSRVCRGVHR